MNNKKKWNTCHEARGLVLARGAQMTCKQLSGDIVDSHMEMSRLSPEFI